MELYLNMSVIWYIDSHPRKKESEGIPYDFEFSFSGEKSLQDFKEIRF